MLKNILKKLAGNGTEVVYNKERKLIMESSCEYMITKYKWVDAHTLQYKILPVVKCVGGSYALSCSSLLDVSISSTDNNEKRCRAFLKKKMTEDIQSIRCYSKTHGRSYYWERDNGEKLAEATYGSEQVAVFTYHNCKCTVVKYIDSDEYGTSTEVERIA